MLVKSDGETSLNNNKLRAGVALLRWDEGKRATVRVGCPGTKEVWVDERRMWTKVFVARG